MRNEDEQSLDDELFWRAFCYVNDEQTPDEARQFEAQLALDQQAREAVAAVVRLSAAVKAPLCELSTARADLAPACHAGTAIPPGTVDPPGTAVRPLRRLWSSRAGWAALALAASLAAVIFSLPRTEKPPRGGAQLAQQTSTELSRYNLASAWADVQAEPEVAVDADFDASITPGSLEDDDELVATDDDAELIVSQWLLEAVTARAEDEGADGAPANTSKRDT